MTTPHFTNGTEASTLALTTTDRRGRSALSFLHDVILESSGVTPLYYMKERCYPDAPLDLLILSNAVLRLFANWPAIPARTTASSAKHEGFLNRQQAQLFADSFSEPVVRRALHRWIAVLEDLDIPAQTTIDVFYCCKLLAPFFLNDSVLANILNGSIADNEDRIIRGNNPWELSDLSGNGPDPPS